MYEFKSEDAYRFAQEAGIEARRNGHNLIFKKCPYCNQNTDSKNKFAIDLNTGMFNCFRASCGAKGNMITLSRDFNFSLGRDVDNYYQTTDFSRKSFKKFRDAHRSIEVRPAAIAYLTSRGISEEVIKDYEITTQPDNSNIVIFPFKDSTGELTFIKYRNTAFKKGETEGSKEWCEKNCKPILFGMNKCNTEKSNKLVITEGQIDSLSVSTANIDNAVSVPTGAKGFTWVPYCYDFVSQFKQIVVFGDCENGIITLSDELKKRWPDKIRVVRQDDYLGCKDANEILNKYGAKAIKDAIDNAEAASIACIKPLSTVKHVDIMSVDMIETHITAFDKVLDGGFRIGQLAILTGKRGEGKSTIASLWGARAIEQGFKCFFYSGELPDFMFRNWMDCQVTGKPNHTQSENDKLDVWYGDNAYIYDNSILENDDEYTSLLDAIKIAIIQRDCRFIVLDNLMTAIDDDLNTDIYRAQSKFVGQLSSIAKKFNVFILLICHPRKNNYQNHITNDDIAGSSHITDKADITIMFGKPKNDNSQGIDEYEREIRIGKNRLTGKINKYPIRLTYDELGSRRLSESRDDFKNRKWFSWDNEDDGFYAIINSEIPF